MNRFIDFLSNIGENRSKTQIEILKRRYPSMFEATTDLTAPGKSVQSIRIANRMKNLKLQTTRSSR
jgi:hypothetical protein